MDSESKHPHEFRRYRQGLTLLYLAIVTAGGALLVASIAWALISPASPVEVEGAPISVEDPDPQELIACHDDLSDLLSRLGDEAAELMARPPRLGSAEIGGAWEAFRRTYVRELDEVGGRCRFRELASAHRRPAYERMAEVYAGLPEQLDEYEEFLQQFDDQQAGELAQMREALRRSRDPLERR